MKILMITGSFPPDVCGVGDYTSRLITSLESMMGKTTVLTSTGIKDHRGKSLILSDVSQWKPLVVKRYLTSAIKKFEPNLIHLQYPTIGYGHSIGPNVIPFLTKLPIVVTLHEASQAHILRKISLIPFYKADRIIATTKDEAQYLSRKLRFLDSKIRVINIGSNVPISQSGVNHSVPIFTYFGLFYPGKGIELFLESAKKSQKFLGNNIRFRIIGEIHPKYKSYYQTLRHESADNNVEWIIGRSLDEVGELISESHACVLPFNDGATFRRGTLLAALVNGVPVITTKGSSTPTELLHGLNVLFANNSDEIVSLIRHLLEDKNLYYKIVQGAEQIGRKFQWANIAQEHIRIYEELL